MKVGMWLLQDSLQHWRRWIAGLYYVRNCLEALARLPIECRPEVVVFAPSDLHEPWLEQLLTDCVADRNQWLTVQRIGPELMNRQSRRELAGQINQAGCDLFFPLLTAPAIPISGKWIGWITDLQHRAYPGFFAPEELEHRDALFEFLLATCSRIVCSSQTVADDLQRHYGAETSQTFILRFVSSTPASALADSAQSTLERLGIDRPFVYLPYQFWAHKNHRVAFEAWRMLAKTGEPPLLVCTGATEDSRDPLHMPMLLDFVEHYGLSPHIRILGLVERADQWQLYRSALAVLQTSLFEGWSTSVEEAKSIGQRILLSDIPVHREQATDRCQFFDPHNPVALAAAVSQLQNQARLADPSADFRSGPDVAVMEVASRMRQQEFGKALLQLFQKVEASPVNAFALRALPLLLRYQDIAEERLELIERLAS